MATPIIGCGVHAQKVKVTVQLPPPPPPNPRFVLLSLLCPLKLFQVNTRTYTVCDVRAVINITGFWFFLSLFFAFVAVLKY